MASRNIQDAFMDDSDESWSVKMPLRLSLSLVTCIDVDVVAPCASKNLIFRTRTSGLARVAIRYDAVFVTLENIKETQEPQLLLQRPRMTHTRSVTGLPILLQQHQEQYEWPLPCMSAAIR